MENSSSLRTLMFKDKFETPNLGDFLRLKENNNNNNRVVASLTLGAVLSSNKREEGSSSSIVQNSNRTLLDIISEDPSSSRTTRKTWKHFRNKLLLKRENENSAPGSTSEILHRNENNEEEEGESEGENAGEETGGGVEDQPVRMSLMALLEENEGDGSAYVIGDENEEEVEEEEEEEDEEEEVGEDRILGAGAGADVGAGGEYNNCCVCMVRHKGAAFIPCGHTFCRLCSRELWVQRGNCPLCNNFILEVLDIF